MSAFFSRIPWRESRPFILTCGVIFCLMAAVLLCWPRPVKQERAIEKKKAEHKIVSVDLYVTVWLRKGWVLNTMLAGAMLLASPWLGKRLVREPVAPGSKLFEGWSPWAWVAVAALTGYGLWNTVPRLSHSMWGDEEFNASRFIADEVTREDDGSLSITPRPWTASLWSFRKTTNHLGFTAVARVVHDTFFHRGTGPRDPFFSEALIRAPVFIAGWCALPALLWASRVWRLGMGWGIAFLVLHPWFTRFAADGRAYGFVLLCVPLLLGMLGRGVETGRWHWWLLYGFTEFFMFWSYFGSVYLLVTLNLAALGLIFAGQTRGQPWLLAARWFVGNIFATMLVIGMMAPCLPQFFEFLEQSPLSGAMDGAWAMELAAQGLLGIPWHTWDAANPLCHALDQHAVFWFIGPVVVFSVLLIAGVARVAAGKEQRWLLVLFLGAPLLMTVHMWHSGIKPYEWYYVPYLPGVVLLLDAALGWASGRWLMRSTLAAAYGLQAWVTLPQHRLLRDHPIEPSRESVEFYRAVTNPRNANIDKDVMSAGTLMFTDGYDPALYRFAERSDDPQKLRELMAQADQTHRALFVNIGHDYYVRVMRPGVFTVLDDPALFEKVQTLPGIMWSTTRVIYHYRGGAKP